MFVLIIWFCSHDCGVLVLKFIKMWDGVSKFDGKVMPNYSTVSLLI